MCLIIAVENDRKMSVRDFEAAICSAAYFNPDGIGVTFADQGKAQIVKRVRDYDTVINSAVDLYQFTTDPFIVHLRYNTKGTNSTANTHPFRISNSITMVHNRTLRIEPPTKDWSDTRTVAELLKRLCKADKTFFNSPLFESFIKHQAGYENRFVFLDAEENALTYVNQDLGTLFKGVWFSNLTSWCPEDIGLLRPSKQNEDRAKLESLYADHEDDDEWDSYDDPRDVPLAWVDSRGTSAAGKSSSSESSAGNQCLFTGKSYA